MTSTEKPMTRAEATAHLLVLANDVLQLQSAERMFPEQKRIARKLMTIQRILEHAPDVKLADGEAYRLQMELRRGYAMGVKETKAELRAKVEAMKDETTTSFEGLAHKEEHCNRPWYESRAGAFDEVLAEIDAQAKASEAVSEEAE